MQIVEEPNESNRVPATDVFSYDSGKPVIGDTFESHYSKYTILGDGRVRKEGGAVFALGRRFILTGRHCVAQADYQNGKVVFRCTHCGTHRVATALASPEAKFYIIGWFMNNKCTAHQQRPSRRRRPLSRL